MLRHRLQCDHPHSHHGQAQYKALTESTALLQRDQRPHGRRTLGQSRRIPPPLCHHPRLKMLLQFRLRFVLLQPQQKRHRAGVHHGPAMLLPHVHWVHRHESSDGQGMKHGSSPSRLPPSLSTSLRRPYPHLTVLSMRARWLTRQGEQPLRHSLHILWHHNILCLRRM